MRSIRLLAAVAVAAAGFALVFASSAPARAQAGAKKRILLITHSGGFIHSSVVQAEKTLRELGEKNNFELVCFRFTNDPAKKATVTKKVDGKDVKTETNALEAYGARFKGSTREDVSDKQIGRINAETLKGFDAVFFFTTGNPVETRDEQVALLDFVLSGKGFLGTHCATDTLYGWKEYGEMIGGYFDGHPLGGKTKVVVEDAKHPIMAGLGDSFEISDELYQHRTPYSREKVRVLMSLDKAWVQGVIDRDVKAIDEAKAKIGDTLAKLEMKKKELEAAGKVDDAKKIDVAKARASIENRKPIKLRTDLDYPMAWCKSFGKGRVFYTALGHGENVWKDPRFQNMVVQAIKWATFQIEGDATPTAGKGAQ